jgi:hypothetical protein
MACRMLRAMVGGQQQHLYLHRSSVLVLKTRMLIVLYIP